MTARIPRQPGRTLIGWLDRLARSEHQLTLVLSLLIGALVGLSVVAFILLTGHLAGRMYPADAPAWRRLVVPVVGSLVSAWLLSRFFPLARGSGIPQTKFALFVGNGVITLPTVVGKFVCCSTSLASGIALGREGPSVHVGAGLASVVGRSIGLSAAHVRALIPLGGAAALAAAFNTPIAGVLFALEEIVGDLHAPILGGAVLSSATAWMILHAFLGDEPLFHVAGYQLVHPGELAIYAVLGVVGGVVSAAFVKLLLTLRAAFLRWHGRWAWLGPVAGGVTVGLLGFFVPEVLGVGYDYIERTLNGDVVLRLVALLAVLKILATATSYASGNAGGIFGPSLFIGAMVGSAIGAVAHGLWPAVTAGAGAYAVVGMGTAFAGIVRTPLTSVIMIFELTRDYTIIVPLMISNLLAYYVSQRLQHVPIYEALALQEGIHLPGADQRGGARSGTVSQVMRPVPRGVSPDCTVAEASAGADEQSLDVWPVVDDSGLQCVVTAATLEDALADGLAKQRVTDLRDREGSGERLSHLHPDQGLPLALERMRASDRRVLPVVSRANVRHLLGMVTFADVVGGLSAAPGESDREPAGGTWAPRFDGRALAATLSVTIVAAAGLAAADGWLAGAERRQNAADARRQYEAGIRLEGQGRLEESLERFRTATSLVRGQPRYDVAFARASLAAGRRDAAERTLDKVLAVHPVDGEANLLKARVSALHGNPGEALAYYQRAIYGQWPGGSAAHGAAARLELVELLARRGPSRELLAELLLLEQTASDPATARRIATLYTTAGAPDRSIEIWRRLRRDTPQDPAVYVGLGDAQLARHDCRAARRSFLAASRLKPNDQHIRRQLRLCDDVLALDPTVRGLDAKARYARSVALLDLVRRRVRECDPAGGRAEAVASDDLSDPFEGAERNLAEAGRLWRLDGESCRGSADDEMLALLFSASDQ